MKQVACYTVQAGAVACGKFPTITLGLCKDWTHWRVETVKESMKPNLDELLGHDYTETMPGFNHLHAVNCCYEIWTPTCTYILSQVDIEMAQFVGIHPN